MHCLLLDDGVVIPVSSFPADRPSYLSIDKNMLYALLREPFPGQSGVQSYKIDGSGELCAVGSTIATGGSIASYILSFHGNVYVTNYISGSTALMPDKLIFHRGCGPVSGRQSSSHPHCVIPGPDGKYLFVADLGADRIHKLTLALEPAGETVCPSGSGPRHILFSGDGRFAYCVNELDSSVSVFSNVENTLSFVASVSSLPEGWKGENAASAIRISAEGKYLYVTNRGHDSICVFRCCGAGLKAIQWVDSGGKSPREMNIFGHILLCANEEPGSIVSFCIGKDGKLSALNHAISVSRPWCILFGM